MNLPEVVSEQKWQRAHEELQAREKAHMREGDQLTAERRRQPMHEITKDYRFESGRNARRPPAGAEVRVVAAARSLRKSGVAEHVAREPAS